jgi:hypothetical protein
MSLFVTFYGDGPYWDNTLLVPAYPSGYLYFRPFRYRDKWVDPKLREKFISEPAGFRGRPANLCMRFRDKSATDRLVPIRRARLSSVQREDDSFVYFKLGEFFEFPETGTLSDFALPMPAEGVSGSENYLLFESDIALPQLSSEEKDAQMWARLGELIAKETVLPIAQEAKQAVFLHFRTPTQAQPATVGEIGTSFTSGAKFGASLPENKAYELVLLHRIPFLIGTNGSIEPVTVSADATNFEISPKRFNISANYGRQVFTITALKASASSEEIRIEPESRKVKAVSGEEIRLEALNIPLRATRNYWYRAWTKWLPLAALAAAIGTQGVVGGWDLIKQHWPLAVLIFFAAVIGSTSVLRIRD